MAESLVEIRDLIKEFPVRGGILQRQVATVRAVDGVDLDILKGETLGLVGESGCGKTTLGRMLTRLLEPTAGTIRFDGEDVTHLSGKDLKPFRRRVQIIFQDPYGSLDPRSQVGPAIAEGLRLHGIGDKDQRQEEVKEMLELVGLRPAHANRYPHEFSGGQRQRIGIARALIL
jgi:peptide/nickel transport system ATP-binding protein